jgi:hypothetical protein
MDSNFTDSSPSHHAVTVNNGVVIDGSVFKFGGGSGRFVASNSQYLSIPDSDDWYFGSGDFTIDFWVKFNSLPAAGNIQVLYCQAVDDSNKILLVIQNFSRLQWDFSAWVSGSITVEVTGNTTISTGSWHHVALVRSVNSWYIYEDGLQLNSPYTNANAMPDFAAQLSIGRYWSNLLFFDGWLDEFHVSKVAFWTSNFTPPTAPYDAWNVTFREVTNVLLSIPRMTDEVTQITMSGR